MATRSSRWPQGNFIGCNAGTARAGSDMRDGNGIRIGYQVMHNAANLETINTYERAHDVHELISGRAQTGLQAFF